MVRFGILGPLEVKDETRAVPLAQGRQRLLLALLLIHARERVSSDRLIDAMWGEAPPPSASRSLHNLISSLRKIIGEDTLVTEGHGYRLTVPDDAIDAGRFRDLAARGRRELAAGDATQAAASLRGALELWRGPALADLAYEPAVASEAGRLDEERLTTVEDRIDADLELGRHAELIGELEALVENHPLRERLCGQLILALYRSGRQADALEAFAHARRRLVDELGIEPGPGLRRLEQAILEQDPELGAADALPPPQQSSRRSPRPRLLAATGAAILLAAAAAAIVLGGSGSHAEALSSLAGNTLAAIDPSTDRVVLAVPVGATPTSVSVGAGAVWVLNADDRTITRFDPVTRQTRTVGIAATPSDLAADRTALWVGVGDSLLRLDDTPAIRAEVELRPANHQGQPPHTGQIAFGAGALWAINEGDDLQRIDPETNRVTAVVHPLRARAVATDGTSVWALAAGDTALVRVDPRSGRILRTVRLDAAQVDGIAVGEGAVWAADSYDGVLWRIDAGPRVFARPIPVGQGVAAVTTGAGSVWAVNSLQGTITRIDPRSNHVIRTIEVGNTPRDADVGNGRLWVTLAGDGPVPAARSGAAGNEGVPGPSCGRVVAASGRPPDVLIASDVPLQAGPEYGYLPIANAVAFTIRQHGFRAGRFRVGYQSCDDSTASSARNGQSDPQKCEANAKAYAATRALGGVVGPVNSGCAEVEIPILNRAAAGPVAIVSPSNSAIGLTHSDPLSPRDALAKMYPTGLRNYARVYPATDAEAAADVALARQLGLRRVFVLDDGSPIGAELGLLFRRSARALRLRSAGHAHWDPGGKGFGALAHRLRGARADGVFLGGIAGASGGPLVRALRLRAGHPLTLIGANPFAPVNFVYDESHGAARGMYVSSPGPIIERLGAGGRRFIREFAPTQPGASIRELAVYAAAATEVMLDAIAHSDGSRASIAQHVLSAHLRDSPIGPISFDANGDLVHPVVSIMQIRARDGVSAVPLYEGAAFERAIVPPPRAYG